MVVSSARHHVTPSELWEAHFQNSLANPPAIPWESPLLASPAQIVTVATSIQEFQLGEQSEGRHLIRVAEEYARRSGDRAYVRALRLFIREEQGHAALLGRFMDQTGIPRIRHNWVDAVFRRLRRLAGLEMSICVLLTAEVIAKIYYRALLLATDAAALREICRRILEDETHHVRFQSERLAILRKKRPPWASGAVVFLQRMLFAGASLVVWGHHRPVLRGAGLTFRGFWKEAQDEFHWSLDLMNPDRYEWRMTPSGRPSSGDAKTARDRNDLAGCILQKRA